MKWASSFKYVPINYNGRVVTVKDHTQRVNFDNNLNGSKSGCICATVTPGNRYALTA